MTVDRDEWGAYVVRGYDDCRALLTDPRLRNEYDYLLTREGVTSGPLLDWWRLAMLNTNPPQHTRLRSLVSQAFTPRAVERVRPTTRALSEELVDDMGEGAVDFVAGFAHLLPIQVICELLGVPRTDHVLFKDWTIDMTLMFSTPLTEAKQAIAEKAIRNLGDYCEDLISARRARPADDLLTALIHAEQDGDRLDHAELVAMVINLLNGGHDTTRSLLMIAVSILAADATLADRLRTEPELLPGAIEETLRYEPTVAALYREAAADIEVAGTTIPAGATVVLSVADANRDPTRFPDPDRFDPTRTGAGILTFGHGAHYCVGNALARLEAHEGLGVILRSWRTIGLDGPRPDFLPGQAVRAFPNLPLTVRR